MSIQDIKKAIQQTIKDIPRQQNITKVALFGSYVRKQDKPQSDIDLLIEFEKPVGYFELVRIQDAFEKELNQKVDLVEPGALSQHFRDEVLQEAQSLYERGSSSN